MRSQCLTLSWQMSLSYRNQSIDLQSKSKDWFLYGIDIRHEKVKINESQCIALFVVSGSIKKLFSTDFANFYLFSIFFSIVFVNIYVFSIFSLIDFARWKSVRLPHICLYRDSLVLIQLQKPQNMFQAFPKI